MTTRLTEIELDEVSLVDRPANQEALVVLHKREVEKDAPADQVVEMCRMCGMLVDPEDRYCRCCGVPFYKGEGDAAVRDAEVLKAAWTAAFINDLPDSSFAVVEPGGKKDDDGKTAPRSLRHLPYKDADGKVDLPHLRNALSRLPQSKLPQNLKNEARRVLDAAARAANVGDSAKKEMSPMADEKKTEQDPAPAAGSAADEISKLEATLEELKKSLNGSGGEMTPEAKALKRIATELVEQRKLAAFKDKAELMKSLPGTTVTSLAALMKDLSDQAPEVWKRLEPLMKNWADAFETSELFSEKGSAGADSASAAERAEAQASDLVAKGKAKDQATALQMVFRADPALYRAYRKETQIKV